MKIPGQLISLKQMSGKQLNKWLLWAINEVEEFEEFAETLKKEIIKRKK